MNEIEIQQANGSVMHLLMPVGWKENLCSTGYILNEELHKGRGVQESSSVGMEKFRKIDPGILALVQDETCTENNILLLIYSTCSH